MDWLFTSYVLNVIGALPPDAEAKLESVAPSLEEAFKTGASDWRSMVRETLHLSETIEVAIKDLWYTNQSNFAAAGQNCAPEEFAQLFLKNFLKDGSKIDVWPPGALEEAKARIKAHEEPNA